MAKLNQVTLDTVYVKRKPDHWVIEINDAFGTVCVVPAAGPDDDIAQAIAKRLAALIERHGLSTERER